MYYEFNENHFCLNYILLSGKYVLSLIGNQKGKNEFKLNSQRLVLVVAPKGSSGLGMS